MMMFLVLVIDHYYYYDDDVDICKGHLWRCFGRKRWVRTNYLDALCICGTQIIPLHLYIYCINVLLPLVFEIQNCCLFGDVCQVTNLVFVAAETHRWYLCRFDDYPRNRNVIVPFLY